LNKDSGQCHGSRRVAADRLSDDVPGRKLRELFLDQRNMSGIGQNKDPFGWNQPAEPVETHLQQAPLAEEGNELFWFLPRAQGPETRPHSPRHDDGHELLIQI
jgi:hypothetical protein